MLHPHSHSHLSGVQTLAKSESKRRRRRRRREGREVFEVKAILGGFHIRRPKIFIFFDPLHPCTHSATYLCYIKLTQPPLLRLLFLYPLECRGGRHIWKHPLGEESERGSLLRRWCLRLIPVTYLHLPPSYRPRSPRF